MSSKTRFWIGGVGGLAPVIIFLIRVDWEHIIMNVTGPQVAGYCVRALVLFLIGGFVAYLHGDEQKPFKAFELGLAAPALIAGYITASSLVPAQTAPSVPGARPDASFAIVGVAYAEPQLPDSLSHNLKRFTLPKLSATTQFLEGLIGLTPRHVWFVIVGSHQRLEDARVQADDINRRNRKFKAEVYAPYGDNPCYAVVIGANLTQREARSLRDKAVRQGFPKDSYYKTFPNLPPPEER